MLEPRRSRRLLRQRLLLQQLQRHRQPVKGRLRQQSRQRSRQRSKRSRSPWTAEGMGSAGTGLRRSTRRMGGAGRVAAGSGYAQPFSGQSHVGPQMLQHQGQRMMSWQPAGPALEGVQSG